MPISSAVPSRLRLRRPGRLAACATLALAFPVAGCGSDAKKTSADVDLASLAPASTAIYAEATIRPEGDLKTSVEALAKKIGGTADPGSEIIKQIDKGLKDDNLTFAKDFDPWLGDKVAVAFTGLQEQDPDFVVIFATTDPEKALATFKKGEDGLADRKYKDVTYSFNATDKMAGATIGDQLLFGSEPALKAAIDADKGTSLADGDKLKKARDSVTDERLAFFYVDPAATINLIAAGNPAFAAQAGPLKSLLGGKKVSALGAALTTAVDAIRIETAVDGQAGKGAAEAAADTVAGLPAGSVAALGFGDIGGQAQKGVAQLEQLGGIYATGLSQFKTITGLDLKADVLSWMGKGGLFVRAKGLADIGGALVVETKDAAKTTAFIDSIQRLVTQFGAGTGATLSPYSGQGAKGFKADIEGLPFPVIVANGGGKFIIAVGEASLREALKPTATLADDATFAATAKQLGAKPAVYLDLQSIFGFVELAAAGDASFEQAKKYLKAFTALAAGSTSSGDTTKGALVVGVK